MAISLSILCFFFFFNDTATTEIYTLSLHDALPISGAASGPRRGQRRGEHGYDDRGSGPLSRFSHGKRRVRARRQKPARRSEEHTSELQSPLQLVFRLLL